MSFSTTKNNDSDRSTAHGLKKADVLAKATVAYNELTEFVNINIGRVNGDGTIGTFLDENADGSERSNDQKTKILKTANAMWLELVGLVGLNNGLMDKEMSTLNVDIGKIAAKLGLSKSIAYEKLGKPIAGDKEGHSEDDVKAVEKDIDDRHEYVKGLLEIKDDSIDAIKVHVKHIIHADKGLEQVRGSFAYAMANASGDMTAYKIAKARTKLNDEIVSAEETYSKAADFASDMEGSLAAINEAFSLVDENIKSLTVSTDGRALADAGRLRRTLGAMPKKEELEAQIDMRLEDLRRRGMIVAGIANEGREISKRFDDTEEKDFLEKQGYLTDSLRRIRDSLQGIKPEEIKSRIDALNSAMRKWEEASQAALNTPADAEKQVAEMNKELDFICSKVDGTISGYKSFCDILSEEKKPLYGLGEKAKNSLESDIVDSDLKTKLQEEFGKAAAEKDGIEDQVNQVLQSGKEPVSQLETRLKELESKVNMILNLFPNDNEHKQAIEEERLILKRIEDAKSKLNVFVEQRKGIAEIWLGYETLLNEVGKTIEAVAQKKDASLNFFDA